MTTPPRSRRAFRADARFLIGIVLVALSLTGVRFVVSSAGRTTPVLQADRTIVQGEVLTSADFRVVEVGLGPLTDEYLSPQDLPTGQVAARTLADGELVPHDAAADPADAHTTTLVIESSTGLPADVAPGSSVELWHAPLRDDRRTFDEPRILVADVIVSVVMEPEGMLASDATRVEVVIDRADVADVLATVTGGSALSVVPVGSAP